VRATTITVRNDGTGGVARGIYISGANRINVRDANIYAENGTYPSAQNVIGCETAHPTAYLQLKTTSVYGAHADVSQTQGTILVANGCDLMNNDANGYGFAVSSQPNFMTFATAGVIDFSSNPAYMMPGTMRPNDIPTIATYIPFDLPVIVHAAAFSASPNLSVGDTATFNVFRYNSSFTQSTLMFNATLTNASSLVYFTGASSFKLCYCERILVKCQTNKNIGNHNIMANIQFI
jgi:hypothetical protein